MRNGDVRSQTRHDAFTHVSASLKKLGRKAEIVEGTLADQESRCAGRGDRSSFVQLGSLRQPNPAWGDLRQSDELWRYLRSGATQTPLSEFLRFGAAGSSGTVVEPFAIQAKFPHPVDARSLCPWGVAGRGLLSVDRGSLSAVDCRRSALSTLGQLARLHGRWAVVGAIGQWPDGSDAAGGVARVGPRVSVVHRWTTSAPVPTGRFI